MQHAVVVKHHQLAGLQAEVQLIGLVFKQLAKALAGAMVKACVSLGHEGNVVQTWAVMHPHHLALSVQLNQGFDRYQFGGGIAVFKTNGHLAQQLEALRIFLAQLLCHGQAVHQGRKPTGGFVLQALQNLNAGYGRAVRVVGVWPQGHRAIGQVVGIWARVNLKEGAKVGVAHKTKAPCNAQNRVGLGRRVVNQQKAQRDEVFEGAVQHLLVGQVGPGVHRLG